MDLEAIWQTHKKFILQVIAGAVVFLVLSGVRGSIADSAAAMAKGNASKELAFQDKKAQLEGAEGREKGRAETLASKLEPALLQSLTWKQAKDLTLPEGEASPVLFYATALKQATSELARRTEKIGAKVPGSAPDLGLVEAVEDPMVVESLARVDLVRGVIFRLLDAGAREVVEVRPGGATYTQRQGDGRFLRTIPVRVVVVGGTRLLADVLAQFQVEGSFLEVTGCRIRRENARPGANLVIELDLRALSVVDSAGAGKVAATPGPSRPTSGGGPRSFGRDR